MGCELNTADTPSALELLHSGGGDRHGNGSQVSALVRPSKNPTGSGGISEQEQTSGFRCGGDRKKIQASLWNPDSSLFDLGFKMACHC